MIEYSRSNIRAWSMLGSCGAFGQAALELPALYNNISVLTADLCFFSGLERFKKQYPDLLLNMGIAEQNMLGVAAGLAKEGFIPFVTSYAAFLAARACDQVRVNAGYMQLNIKMIGLTSGLSTGILGATHMCIEDIAVIRAIPNILLLSPADCTETVKAVIAAAQYNGPVYLRLTGAMNNPPVYKEDYNYEIGKAITLRAGTDIAIVATGSMVYASLKAAEELSKKGINCSVIDMHTIKPLDTDAIDACLNHKLIVTVEEHSVIGGLGSAVAEHLAMKAERPRQLILGIEDFFPHAGDYNYLLKECGLTGPQIAERILKAL